jgi:hypothetical protein
MVINWISGSKALKFLPLKDNQGNEKKSTLVEEIEHTLLIYKRYMSAQALNRAIPHQG